MIVGIDASNLRQGGGVTHLRSLLRSFEKGRFGIHGTRVWSGESTLNVLPTVPGVVLDHQPALDGNLISRTLWQQKTLRELAPNECDVLFSPGGLIPRTSMPSVTMCQNMLPFSPTEKARYGASGTRVRLELLERAQTDSFSRSHGVIFLSDYAKQAVSPRLAESTVATVIPHGVDQEFRYVEREPRPITACTNKNPFRVLYVSTIDFYKHQWIVAEAVSRLRRAGMPISLDLVGPAYPPAGRRLTKTLDALDPASEFLRYRGSIPHHELPEVYQGTDLFVFASSCENLPIILIEAMAAALPIVSSDRGPMPEALGNAGRYFDPESVDSTQKAVEDMVHDLEARRSLARVAQERSRRFDWNTCARDTFSFLARIEGQHG